ncbi:hypothetical protein I4U23_012591 [Adineta vaga]|nr:hypothetical protein I4U23_012591 [Adineta vaga]
MSSVSSDSIGKTTFETITNSIAQIQRKEFFTQQRFRSIRQYFFQSIGLLILLYFICQIPYLFYLLIKYIFQLIFHLLTIIFWPLLKLFQLILPKTTNYGILFPLFVFSSILSFFTTKLSIGKRSHLSKTYSFPLFFLIFLLLQSIFILRPISLSIHEQRKLSLNSSMNKQTSMRLSEKIDEYTSTKMSSSLKNNSKSDVNDEHSNFILNKKKENMLVEETFVNDSVSEVSSHKEQKLVFKQQANNLANSKFFRKSSEQIKQLEKLNKWLDETWNIWHDNKFPYSPWKLHMQHIPQRDVSSIYAAYTNLDCTEHREFIDRQVLSKQKHIYILDFYRNRSPFPIYLSILKSNGPQCYRYYVDSFCANSSIYGKNFLYYFAQFWMIISIPLILFVIISRYHQQNNKKKQSSKSQQIISNQMNDLSLEQISVNIKRKNSLIEKIEKELHVWLEQERIGGYRNLSETYRRTLNDRCLKEYDYLQIESLQFSNVTVSHLSQTSNSSTVINAILTINSSVFTILNPIKQEQYLVEIRKLTGDLEISLLNGIELKFTTTQIGSVEIIDSKNVSSTDGKQSILNLLTDLINKTTVQFTFQQEKTTNQPLETKGKPKKLLVRIVKAVKLHDVEQPFCVLELNHPKQVHKTSIAKNGVNPFWDEHFIFDCDDKSNEIHLKIFDRKKPTKKVNTNLTEKLYADVSIPFSYVTSTIYKQDVRITPQYPESIIRIEKNITDQKKMVYSRSATNLNRIFLDLCTSPDVRRKHDNNQRHYHPPLPNLKPTRSNSCPNIDEISQNMATSSSSSNDQIEQDLPACRSTAMPLAPIESIGFTVQPTLSSLKLFGTFSINQPKKASTDSKLSDTNKKTNFLSLPIDSQLATEDIQNPDFIHQEVAVDPHRIDQNRQLTPSTADASPSDRPFANNFYNNTSSISQTTTADIFPTPPDDNSPLSKPRKSRSIMSSLRNFTSFRRKKTLEKGKLNENGVISSPNCTIQTNTIPHSFSAEPFLYSNATGATSFHREQPITRSFRNLFRSSTRKKPQQTDNFILDHPDLLSTSPNSLKKNSFFQRFRSKRKTRRLHSLANSLTSYDRTRTESIQNTPIRANGNRPVTMTK